MILDICKKAKKASVELAKLSTEVKNKALYDMAEALEKNTRSHTGSEQKGC